MSRPAGDRGAGRRGRRLGRAGPQAACVPGAQHRGTRPALQGVLGFLFGVAFLLPLAGDAEPAGLTRIGLTDVRPPGARSGPAMHLGAVPARTDASHGPGPTDSRRRRADPDRLQSGGSDGPTPSLRRSASLTRSRPTRMPRPKPVSVMAASPAQLDVTGPGCASEYRAPQQTHPAHPVSPGQPRGRRAPRLRPAGG
jgi:hypothetical protein